MFQRSFSTQRGPVMGPSVPRGVSFGDRTGLFAGDSSQMKAYVLRAFDLHRKGDSSSYELLVAQLQRAEDAASQRQLFSALSECISTIIEAPDAYRLLINAIFKHDWHANKEVNEAYLNFLTHLISANGTFLLPSFQMLVRSLLPPLNLAALSAGGAAGSRSLQPSSPSSSDVAVYNAIHSALEAVLRIVPAGSTILFPVLVEHFPHKRVDKITQKVYVEQLLRIADSFPFLADRIFVLIVERLIEIDVEIKLDENEEDLLFSMDSLWASGEGEEEPDMEALDIMADKLDVLMVLVFEYVQKRIDSTPYGAKNMFQLLMQVFEGSMLSTHRSKFTQFLIFFVCKEDIDFVDAFVAKLIAIIFDAQRPVVLRQSASAYLASFLARAKYVRQSTLRSTFSHLLRWITDEVEEVGENYTDSEESKRRNTLFYTISQAVFYLLCFQGGFIAAADQGKEFLAAFLWEKIIRSPMNPLKYCLESVRREFVRVARVLHLVAPALLSDLEKQLQDTGDSGIPKPSPRSSPSSSLSLEPKAVGTRINGIAHRLGGIGAIGAVKIVTAATTKVSGVAKQRGRGVGGLGSGSNPLDSYFPFDPYLLRRSFRFVAELYNEWEAIEEEEEDDDETSSEEGEEEEEEDAEEEEEEDDQREDDLPPEYSSYVSALSISAESTPGIPIRRVRGTAAGRIVPRFGNFDEDTDVSFSGHKGKGETYYSSPLLPSRLSLTTSSPYGDEMSISPVTSGLTAEHFQRHRPASIGGSGSW